jgi:predicted protein tyrosine phosphatase
METPATYETQPIPEGYMRDAQGRLHPLTMVRPEDKQRDALVRDLYAKFLALRACCTHFRATADADIDAHLELAQERYQVKRGGQVGNLVLSSFDGAIRVVRAVDKLIAFTDEIHAAKTLIFACVAEWVKDARPELAKIADEAFRTDKQGHLSADRILSLLRWDIADERWQRAMQAIKDSIQVQSTRTYLRFYKREADGSYAHVPAGV